MNALRAYYRIVDAGLRQHDATDAVDLKQMASSRPFLAMTGAAMAWRVMCWGKTFFRQKNKKNWHSPLKMPDTNPM